ncbi:MAG: NYN domain-containing protein [Thermoleophilia bacterium]|nr:NYN domain-containing protein [Thermoleophilia bacterium]
MPEPTLYLFDGHNLLHAGAFGDHGELRDRLASFVALRGVRGVLVFDGSGVDARHGPLHVRYAPDADAVLERLAAEHRGHERVCVVSSDAAIRRTSGQEVASRSSGACLAELRAVEHDDRPRAPLAERLDIETRARLERLRRGR